jgi:hypothetical protein
MLIISSTSRSPGDRRDRRDQTASRMESGMPPCSLSPLASSSVMKNGLPAVTR